MNKNTLFQGEPWMTPEERNLNHEFIQTTTQRLAVRGVPETPFILIRINDVIATWLLARRLESALTPEPGEPAPCPTPAQAGAIGKCRDRLRRAMKELEACCPPNTIPAENYLAGQMHQVTHERSETNPNDDSPNDPEPQPAENADENKTNKPQSADSARRKSTNQNPTPESNNHDPKHSPNPAPAVNHPAPPITARPPELGGSTAIPAPPHDAPNEQSPFLNRAARRRQAREERHNKKGRRLYTKKSGARPGPGQRTSARQPDP